MRTLVDVVLREADTLNVVWRWRLPEPTARRLTEAWTEAWLAGNEDKYRLEVTKAS